ncbi:hypothetical protein E1B28_013665 [Marasmius oreades]|uniref:RanBP2-type domain-containing protein n=1 Tax=Marasmius oreades TaxID=181124 RepID=A0A9P7RQ93_9AGAR|nr:uncharacterized protein E1B28_013665 [Marasmius oreades]KAG7087719.1 hypothetical protein E1B28_013665 [Marasmius oreades]
MQSHQLSTNPPSSFRVADWIYPESRCSVHNFGRNPSQLGCGTLRTFVSQPTSPSNPQFQNNQFERINHYDLHSTHNPSRSILTPSGRAFAIGGRIQNISSDPLSPCIMYWPDNEPLPEPGQIRPGNLLNITHPPIVNTGNRGPITHQAGDWICKKCSYLNWRRRKVCQTCLPYAEGNGDSISALQAERIAFLTSALAQTSISSCPQPTPAVIPSRHSQSLTSQGRQFGHYEHHLDVCSQRLRRFTKPGQARPNISTDVIYQTAPSISDPLLAPRGPSLLPYPYHLRRPQEDNGYLQGFVSSPSDSDSSEVGDSEADASWFPKYSTSRFSGIHHQWI